MKILIKRTRATEDLRIVVFRGKDSVQHERIFRTEIFSWLMQPRETRGAWSVLIRNLLYKVNKDGNLRYCYFSEYHQSVQPTRLFQQWADAVRLEISQTLKQLYAGQCE